MRRFFGYSISSPVQHPIGGHSHLLNHQSPILARCALHTLAVVVAPAWIISDPLSSELLNCSFKVTLFSLHSASTSLKNLLSNWLLSQSNPPAQLCILSYPPNPFPITPQFKHVIGFGFQVKVQFFVCGILVKECCLIPCFW